jgi:hypothetical protein
VSIFAFPFCSNFHCFCTIFIFLFFKHLHILYEQIALKEMECLYNITLKVSIYSS